MRRSQVYCGPLSGSGTLVPASDRTRGGLYFSRWRLACGVLDGRRRVVSTLMPTDEIARGAACDQQQARPASTRSGIGTELALSVRQHRRPQAGSRSSGRSHPSSSGSPAASSWCRPRCREKDRSLPAGMVRPACAPGAPAGCPLSRSSSPGRPAGAPRSRRRSSAADRCGRRGRLRTSRRSPGARRMGLRSPAPRGGACAASAASGANA